jgi:hypothetical protein
MKKNDTVTATIAAVTSVQLQSSSIPDTNKEKEEEKQEQFLQRKITLATEGFATIKYSEKVLRDRNRLSQENALTVAEYIISMKREVNPRLSYIRYTIQFLSELSKSAGIEKPFKDMAREDILSYLDRYRKFENEDPLHKWIGSYNIKRVTLMRFFKWLYYTKTKSALTREAEKGKSKANPIKIKSESNSKK